jgi:RimJ/RimL family protein N-acetyltransferase
MLNPATVPRRRHALMARRVRLPDGARISIRPIGEEDAEGFAHAFTRLSDESRRRRFLSETPRLSARALTYLTAVDHDEHVALVAVEPKSGEILGSVRYMRIAERRAELAIEVIDDWQGRGLGRALLEAISAHAHATGLTRFTALVAADNLPMQHALKRAVVTVEVDHGELEYVLDVDALAPAPRRSPAIRSTPAPATTPPGPRLQPAAILA